MEQLDDDALNIYTDGSSFERPRRGGIGFRFVTVDEAGGEEVYEYEEPGYRGATNNEMEIWAAVKALRVTVLRWFPIDLSRFRKIVVYTDSTYLQGNYTNALYTWPQTKWTTRSGAPVENADLWQDLVAAMSKTGKRVEFKWIKGKKGPHAKAVDKLAKAPANNALNPPLRPSRVRRKKSPNQIEIGSVVMEGQTMNIRIQKDQWMPVQRLHQYRYEVVSEDSPYFEKVDRIFSGLLLAAGHVYSVQVNNDTGNPRVVELLAEIQDSPEKDKPE